MNQRQDFHIDRMELFYAEKYRELADHVKADIQDVSPHTAVNLVPMELIPSNIINVGDGETIIASAWYHSVLLIGYNDKGFYHIEAVNQNKKVFLDFEKSLSQYEVFGRKAILYK